ncbi:hypothetical protein [Rickettsia tamurae]|uniref:hypothetical protein n=1 Tax=Rickettsia tamurae TaxID=334545 RepID=UPI001BFEDA1B|nr:hypothetical protein [Rickettsia tamurae]
MATSSYKYCGIERLSNGFRFPSCGFLALFEVALRITHYFNPSLKILLFKEKKNMYDK